MLKVFAGQHHLPGRQQKNLIQALVESPLVGHRKRPHLFDEVAEEIDA